MYINIFSAQDLLYAYRAKTKWKNTIGWKILLKYAHFVKVNTSTLIYGSSLTHKMQNAATRLFHSKWSFAAFSIVLQHTAIDDTVASPPLLSCTMFFLVCLFSTFLLVSNLCSSLSDRSSILYIMRAWPIHLQSCYFRRAQDCHRYSPVAFVTECFPFATKSLSSVANLLTWFLYRVQLILPKINT